MHHASPIILACLRTLTYSLTRESRCHVKVARQKHSMQVRLSRVFPAYSPGRQHLLGVRRQAEHDIFISFDPEVESPVPVDTCLPDASRFVILLQNAGDSLICVAALQDNESRLSGAGSSDSCSSCSGRFHYRSRGPRGVAVPGRQHLLGGNGGSLDGAGCS